MAIEAVSAKKYGPNEWHIEVTESGETLGKRIEIPDPLPEEYANKKAFLYAQAKRMVRVIRNRRQSAIDEAAKWDEANATVETVDADDILTQLVSEDV